MPTHRKRSNSPEKADLATPVSDRVQIRSIRLLECHAEQKSFGDELPGSVVTQINVETHLESERSELEVFSRFSLVVRRTGSSPEDEFLRVEARFAILYSLKSLEGLQQSNYEAFGERNGVYNVWPYWREFVQSTTVRMGLPPLTLPVFRLGISRSELQAGPEGVVL